MTTATMDFERIATSVDVALMGRQEVTAVGGCRWLVEALVRCGVPAVNLVDFDRYSTKNIPRQDTNQDEVGQLKVATWARSLKRINPRVKVRALATDFCTIDPEVFDRYFGRTTLWVFGADDHAPQARGNREALRLGTAAVWVGLYAGGRAGEIIYYVPGLTPACYRCIAVNRYQQAARGGIRIPSDGGTIFDMHLVDAIAGQICLGILTRGAANRYGRLVEQLGNRNLLQVKIDPAYRLGGRDVFGRYLGDHPANFSFTTIALPMDPEPECPDCREFRGAERQRDAADHSA